MFKPVVKNVTLSLCIKSMWRNWVVPVGVVMLIFILASFADKFVVAATTLLSSLVLLQLRKRLVRKVDTSMCVTTCLQVSIILFVSAVTMFTAMWTLRGFEGRELNGQSYNPDIPYLTTILIAAIAMLVTGTVWALHLNRRRMERYMRVASGRTSLTVFRARLLNREAIFHTKLLCCTSALIFVIGTIYYFRFYINVNLSHKDILVYAIVPAVIYLLTLLYLSLRYYSFYAYYCHNDYLEMIDRGGRTSVRYMILHDDRIFLVPRSYENGVKVDTPTLFVLPYRPRFSLYDAINLLRQHAELREGCTIEPAFETVDKATEHNAYHFFVFLNDDKAVKRKFPEGSWYTLGALQQMMAENKISVDLRAELHRIYTVAMAYKTYDADGRRLYKIKNYRPTFRLKDLSKWDVDYNDDNWIRVAHDNQDKPLWGVRRVWRKFINSITTDE